MTTNLNCKKNVLNENKTLNKKLNKMKNSHTKNLFKTLKSYLK